MVEQAQEIVLHVVTLRDEGDAPVPVAICGNRERAVRWINEEVDDPEERTLYSVEETPLVMPEPRGWIGEWVLASAGWRWIVPTGNRTRFPPADLVRLEVPPEEALR